MAEYKPWENSTSIEETVKNTRKTSDVSEGMNALTGIRQKMGKVLKKDQSLKVSMFVPHIEKHEEGEVWEQDNRVYTIKNGIRQTISKFRGAKNPWFCPECGKVMRGKADDRMWILRSKCHGCVVEEEAKIRLEGNWEEYEAGIMRANAISYLKEMIMEVEEYISMVAKPQIHMMDGSYEEWDVNMVPLKDDLKVELNLLQTQLDELEKVQNESS